jgi:hypothetical protein
MSACTVRQSKPGQIRSIADSNLKDDTIRHDLTPRERFCGYRIISAIPSKDCPASNKVP